MKKTIAIVALMALVVMTTFSYAQNQAMMGQGRCFQNPAIKNYVEKNILPVMKVQRQQLDKELSQTEKDRLAEIRSQLQTLRQQRREEMKSMRAQEGTPSLEQRKAMRQTRNQLHSLMNEVAEMEENHDATIMALLDEVRPQVDQWRKEIRQIVSRNCPNADTRPGMMKNGKNKHGKKGMYGKQGMPFGKLLVPNVFLLWNPDEPLPFFNRQNIMEDNMNFNIYPNPASGEVQFSVQLEEESNIGYQVFDKDGIEVLTKDAENAPAGLFSVTIDVSGLTNGLYIVKVKAGERSAIGRLIVKH
jgi:Skp family chaperone for outer membrane proteins